MPEPAVVHPLVEGWSFKQDDADDWLTIPRVPTNVHLDLIHYKRIEDPFLGFNELKCQWVGEKTWLYRAILPRVAKLHGGLKYVLAFDGLDTFATVAVNGRTILESDNMWIMHRVDVTDRLRPVDENILEIRFKPALLEAKKIKEAHSNHRWVGYNGDIARLAVRKAQYHWGWDWGPVLMTCGPWRAVRLEAYEARVSDVRVDYDLDSALKKVSGVITASVEGESGRQVKFSAKLGSEEIFNGVADVNRHGQAHIEFLVNKPRVWYPRGYGQQPLYTIIATVIAEDLDLHSLSKRIGFRRSELIQEPDEMGRSFFFRVNGIDIFCGGSDWIPADSFTPRISEKRYREWLELLVEGNQTMVRIWGGGIWEEDCFYDICDELGILVWQDFMFACGNYPCYPAFLQSVEAEAVCQVKRLRHHPCIAIYAGNNEDYQIQEQLGLTYNYEDKDPQRWLKTDFPARYIYEKLLPEVVQEHSPHVTYHPGSPWGDGKPTSDPTVGDLHQWNVWHGTQEKYQVFDRLGGRFNSEFGLEAFPHIDTIKYFVELPTQLYPQSQTMDFHNKAAGHERRIATYLVENFRAETELEKFIHLTQLSQAEALSFAYRGWRRQWGQKRLCGGALVWQLNDCWPVTSWAIVDYFLRKKPAFYVMRRALAPVAVAVKRAHHDWSADHAQPAETIDYECWVSSSKLQDITATVELRYVSVATGQDIKSAVLKRDIRIVANGTTEVYKGTIDNIDEEQHVLAARLWVEGEIVSRDVDWPQPLKYLDFDHRAIRVVQQGDRITVKAARPVKGLVFEERQGVWVSDSCIDVVPGDEQSVNVTGLGERDHALKWRYLGGD